MQTTKRIPRAAPAADTAEARRLKQIEASIARLSREARSGFYPSADDITYIARIAGQTAVFLTDDTYSRHWFYPRYKNEKLHEPVASNFLMKTLTAESVFVDVGAHLGYFSILAGLKAKKVFAIEALEFLIPRIQRNVSANHLANVNTILAAAGDKPGFVPMPKVGGPGNAVGSKGAENLVPMIRLDDYFQDDLTPDIIKIDTEGFEYQVLQGAEQILKRRPTLLIEVHARMTAYGHDMGELFDLLTDGGYAMALCQHRVADSKAVSVTRERMFELDNAMLMATAKKK